MADFYTLYPKIGVTNITRKKGGAVPKRCRGSTHLPGCRSQAWWDQEDLFFQAAGGQTQKNATVVSFSFSLFFSSSPSPVGRVRMFTHCHVGGAAGAASFGLGVDEASADAKVAQFDLTFRVQQDVGGFDVSVDDAVLFFQIQQRLDDLGEEEALSDLFFFFTPLPPPSHKATLDAVVFFNLLRRSSFRESAPGWDPGFFSSASQRTFPSAPWR